MSRTLSSLLIALTLLIGGLTVLVPAETALAKIDDNPNCPTLDVPKTAVCPILIKNYLKVGSLRELIIKNIPNFLLAMIGVVCLVYFLLNALKYLFGAGATESTGEAKNGMLAAVIGLVVALTAFGVITLVGKLIDTP